MNNKRTGQPTAQTGYESQPSAQPTYGTEYGAHPARKTLANPAVYGQTAQSPSTPEGYGQRAPQSQIANNPTFTTKEYSQLMTLLHKKNGKGS
ncbi:hypothetical protein C1H46_000031 [Malus baccata]|uniref:Uncharacterized protein n=1 Tax=Malus baccata TaxID=106549 RepID=A0A540NSU5_MALBA|nr:hypothetical protein C1H46_000031 [Malus baccata]